MSVNLSSCQTMCFCSGQARNERERETEASRLGEGGRGKSPRSARRRARAALNVGMFRYLLKRLHMGKKEKSSSML